MVVLCLQLNLGVSRTQTRQTGRGACGFQRTIVLYSPITLYEATMNPSGGWEYQSIPIDFDVWKALNNLLESPQDTHNDALRRLLNLQGQRARASGQPWIVEGVTFPHGTEFRARYKNADHSGIVDNGALVVHGKRFDSPSPAAYAITGTSVNGWKFWHCRYPGATAWVAIDGQRHRS